MTTSTTTSEEAPSKMKNISFSLTCMKKRKRPLTFDKATTKETKQA